MFVRLFPGYIAISLTRCILMVTVQQFPSHTSQIEKVVGDLDRPGNVWDGDQIPLDLRQRVGTGQGNVRPHIMDFVVAGTEKMLHSPIPNNSSVPVKEYQTLDPHF